MLTYSVHYDKKFGPPVGILFGYGSQWRQLNDDRLGSPLPVPPAERLRRPPSLI